MGGSTCSEEETKCLLDIWADANIWSMLENTCKNSDAFKGPLTLGPLAIYAHTFATVREFVNSACVCIVSFNHWTRWTEIRGPLERLLPHLNVLNSLFAKFTFLFTPRNASPTVVSNDWTIYAHTCAVDKFSDCCEILQCEKEPHQTKKYTWRLVRTKEIKTKDFLVWIRMKIHLFWVCKRFLLVWGS